MIHMKVTLKSKKFIHYIKGTYYFGIKYSSDKVNQLVGYNNLDWDRDGENNKSASGYVF